MSLGLRREESHGAQDFAPHSDAIYASPVIDHGRVKFPSQKLPFWQHAEKRFLKVGQDGAGRNVRGEI